MTTLVFTNPSGPPGAIVELQTPAGTVKSPVSTLAGLGITTSDVTNVSTVPGATATNALDNLKGRIDGLTTSQVANASGVAGATASNALDTLAGIIAALTSTQVANASAVPGATVTAALNFLLNNGYGTQAAWAIDPATGNDANSGTPASPLRTMAEFNRRLSNNAVLQATTLQLVGDVTDAPLQLANTRFAANASLTMSGTTTTVGSATITNVATLNALTTFQLTTTGVVWTSADVGKRLLMPTGQVGWVQEFVDASNIITGGFCSTAGGVTTPTNGLVLSVQTVSTCSAPSVEGTATSLANVVVVRDVFFQPVNLVSQVIVSGIPILFFGCSIKPFGVVFFATTTMSFFGCFLTTAFALNSLRSTSMNGNTLVSCPLVLSAHTVLTLQTTSLSASAMNVQSRSIVTMGTVHVRNTASPLTVQTGAIVTATGVLSGGVGNTGVGVTVKASSQYVWTGANKPTVTGSTPGTNDVKVGATTMGYAALANGFIDLQTSALPLVSTQIVGTPAFMGLEA